jgi:hypothetical protein
VKPLLGVRIDVQLDRGDTVRLPATYAADGHLDHGYALTAHKAQGATFDRAYVLGSDEAYREWGYTALSRHRQVSTFYITTPRPFLNTPGLPDLDTPVERAASLLGNERRKELAFDLTEPHDPAPAPARLPDLDEIQPIPAPANDLDLDLGWDLGP